MHPRSSDLIPHQAVSLAASLGGVGVHDPAGAWSSTCAAGAAPAHLRQWLRRVLGVNVAQDEAQPEAALQLLDARVDVVRLQQVVPAQAAAPCRGGVSATACTLSGRTLLPRAKPAARTHSCKSYLEKRACLQALRPCRRRGSGGVRRRRQQQQERQGELWGVPRVWLPGRGVARAAPEAEEEAGCLLAQQEVGHHVVGKLPAHVPASRGRQGNVDQPPAEVACNARPQNVAQSIDEEAA